MRLQYRLITQHQSRTGTHTRDPVPFAIKSPFLKPDGVKKFDEVSAKNGAFGLVEVTTLFPFLYLQSAVENQNFPSA